ncbi:MAG: hypothetical protein AMS16_00925 [Planctomycetes bacterium DG_58]|nr:MAG: hypothetical protein AMS16_00925 [Planctomycetes bacterium DG_58]
MPIVVTCECGKVLKVPEEHAGKRGKCPGCGKVITIPTAESQAPPSPERVAPAPPEAQPTPEAPAPEEKAPPAPPPTDTASAIQRLKQLEEQIPYTDEDELGVAKELALGLAAIPGLFAEAANDMLTRLKGRLDEHAQTVGEDDPHVKILGEMLSIGTRVVEGKK